MINADRIYVIAEAGINHNGNVKTAKELIDAAVEAKADCVKFQTFVPQNLVSKHAEKADYQKQNTGSDGSQLDMLSSLALTWADFEGLAHYAEKRNIDFCSTAFDAESVRFMHGLGCKFWKIPSGEITNFPYLVQIAGYGEPIVMSTGMSTMQEVEEAVAVIRKYNRAPLVLLHCNTEYPTPYRDVNLLAMGEMKKRFSCSVGYSDHTLGIEIPIAAAALGARVIEKHFTLSRALAGPDHKASLEPGEFQSMVCAIRNVEAALGDGVKVPTVSEQKNIEIARKSIVAARPIVKGEQFTEENLTTKRPGTGISPMRWKEILGTCADRDYQEDDFIQK